MRKTMIGIAACLVAAAPAGNALAAKAMKVDAARIEQIAGWLPAKPAADGAPATDRAKWDALAAMPSARSCVKEAEKLLDSPVPECPDEVYLECSRTGNRTNYQNCLSRRNGNFVRLMLAECYEHKGRFIAKICEYVDAFAAERSWVMPAHDLKLTAFNGAPHVDLGCGRRALEVAYCANWLADELPAATRTKMLAELDRRVFGPYLATARGTSGVNSNHWWFHGGNNWNSVCHSCVVRAALAVVSDARVRAEIVAHAEAAVPYALAGYTDDGYCTEGMGYWNYGYGHHLMMGLSVRAATGGKVDFFRDPKTKDVMRYAYGYQIQHGLSPHFADGGGNPTAVYLALGRQVWPDLLDSDALNCPLLAGDLPAFSLRAFGQEPSRVEPTLDTLPPRSWFPAAQVLISRSDVPERGLKFGVAIKGGNNDELHNHNDLGSYTVMMDSCEMTGDPGGEVYTRWTFSNRRYESKMLNSYGHPVPVVGGELQPAGRAQAAKILKTEFTDAKDTIVIDLTKAYKVKTLKSLVRTMTFDRAKETITIADHVEFTAPTAFEEPVVTYRAWEKDAEAKRFTFSKPKGQRRMRMAVASSAPYAFSTDEIENPSRPKVQRLSFAFKEPVLKGDFSVAFTAQ